jgi:uroporphyrinogen-III synthase
MIFSLIEFARPEDCVSLDAVLAEIYRFDWVIFTSGQAVKAVAQRLAEAKFTLGGKNLSEIRCAAVGPGTAHVARQAGFRVNYVAETHSGVSLARELGSQVKGCTVLLPRSDRANPDLPAALRQQGALVTEVVAYRTIRPQSVNEGMLTAILSGEADAILFYSPSAVHHFEEIVGRSRFQMLQETMAITAVGPVTAAALRDTGVERIEVAADTTGGAVIDALERHYAVRMNPAPAGAKRV